MINIRFILIGYIGLLLAGCTGTNSSDASNKSKLHLKSTEIIKLVSQKTLYIDDKAKTRRFFDLDRTVYDYYTRDEDGHHGKWYVKDNRLCLLYQGFKTNCSKVEKTPRGYIIDGELIYKIVNGDKFNIKNSFDW